MRQISLDLEAKEAKIGGGVTAADLSAAMAACDLAAVTGNTGDVGMAGLLLGGGYGRLQTRCGVASDSLLSAAVVSVGTIMCGTIVFPWADARLVLQGYSNNMASASAVSSGLAPLALPGGYANVLGPDARDQIAAAYGANGPRLLELKKKFDPENIFSAAIPLPAGARR
jgi:FAD/FMN-containing dehydrogenase